MDLDEVLSCVGVGWYEGRAMGLRKGERVQGQVGEEVLMEVVEDAEVAWWRCMCR